MKPVEPRCGYFVTHATINSNNNMEQVGGQTMPNPHCGWYGLALDMRIGKVHWNVWLQIRQNMELSCCRRSYLVLTTLSLATYSVLLFKWERLDIIRGEQKLLERVVCTYKRRAREDYTIHISIIDCS